MNKFIHKLGEHAAAIVIGAIVLIVLILAVIVFALASAGNTDRRLIVEDIAGSAFILKTDGQLSADKNMKLESGDVLITAADSTVRLSADKDKSVYVEPDTTLYIYYTEASDKGSIVVNISEGAAVCRLDSALGKNEIFEVKTPNAVISCTGTVFRTQFSYFDNYGSYTEAKVTDVDCVDGSVNIQLYDNNAMPAEPLMMLTEGKSARLLTAAESVRYEYLNSDIRMELLSENALKTFIRIAAERRICFSLGDLNDAYQLYLNGGTQTEQTTLFDVDNYTEGTTASNIFPEFTGTVTTVPAETLPTGVTGDSSAINSENMGSVTGTEFTGLPPEESSITVTTVPEDTGQSVISVTSPTSAVYTVSQSGTAPGSVTSASGSPIDPAVTTPPVVTTSPVVTTAPPAYTTMPIVTTTSPTVTAAPPTVTAAPPAVTTAPPAVTTASPETTTTPLEETNVTTATTPTETTKSTETTVPWWEIINSAALTKDRTE